MSQIIHMAQARPDAMLTRLKRLTGLDFDQVPESLLPAGPVTGGQPGEKKPVMETGARRMGDSCSGC
ncbi:MAG: hypothetical protein P1U64_12885 [Alcanivoracaceae bacterium]|jgi:hypothetical protein|nr:hypothetical protein [Alcanivoracaceae bacterium]